MRIFITGASGFVGSAITRRLTKSGEHTLIAMSRSTESDAKSTALGATPVRCELGGVQAAHVSRCDTIIHNTACVQPWGRRADFQRISVEGTRQLLAVAREAGVRRFVNMSSDAVSFAGQNPL